jgi:hypothetical protein
VSCAPDGGQPDGGQPDASGPVLPPRATTQSDVSAEMWDQWAAELGPTAATNGRRSRRHRHRWLLPTRGASIIATLGWVGLVLAQMLLIGALVPSFDLGDTRNFVVPLDESPWFGATTIVSSAAAYVGWFWWTVSAAFNVRRVSPLSTSPGLPIVVYLLGPIGVLAGLEMSGPNRVSVLFVAIAAMGIGHVMVVGSFRSAASRIGAQSDEFAKLLWLPMAGAVYRLFVNVVLELLPDEWHTTMVLFGLGTVGALFVCGMVLSTWRATTSFEYACHRLNTRSLGAEMPSVGVLGAALRKSS